MDPLSSASLQKALKLSLHSIDSYTESNASPKHDINSRISTIPEIQDLDSLISLLKSTLSNNDFSNLPNDSDTLRVLVHTICQEYTQNPIKEVRMNNPESKKIEEVSVNFMKTESHDPINKVFSLPDNGVWLSNGECKELAALVIGALRDSASHVLKLKIRELQEKVIGLALRNNQLKLEISDKNFEIDRLADVVDRLEKGEKSE